MQIVHPKVSGVRYLSSDPVISKPANFLVLLLGSKKGPMVGLLSTVFVSPHYWVSHFPLHSFLLIVFQNSDKQEGVYDILWAVVFGFATLNIVGLALRRFETSGNRLNLGEILAIMVVGVSVVLLGWEMLYVLKILPFKLQPHD